MRGKPSPVSWMWTHPLLALGAFLVLEAFLPVRFQPTAWLCQGAIRVYQLTLSPILGAQCKFTPTCSHYGMGCIRKYGTLRGGLLTTWRILRCSPFTHGGDDPVP